MTLENVKAEIINDANKQAAEVVAAAEKEAAALREKTVTELTEGIQKAETEIRRQAEAEKKKEIAKAQFNSKKILQDTKRELIDDVFLRVSERLEKKSSAERKKIIQSLIAKGKKQLTISTVYCNKRDLSLVSGFTKKEADIAGGVIVENKEGTERVDYSYEALLSHVRDTQLGEIAEKLF